MLILILLGRYVYIYICRSSFVGDIYKDIVIEYNDDKNISSIILNNGVEIEFDDLTDSFGFSILKKDGKCKMNTMDQFI